MQQILSVGWFPEDEWAAALEQWPELGDEMPRDHVAYRAAIEHRLRAVALQTVGARLVPTPLTVAAVLEQEALAASEGGEPAGAQVRGRAASLRAQQGFGTAWPPERNAACWCGSGRKYKQCCACLPAPATSG